MKIRIGIIFGGRSGEHEISVRSAAAVIGQIDPSKYEVFPIAIDKQGHWLNPAESVTQLPDGVRSLLAATRRGTAEAQFALIGDPRFSGLTEIGGDTGTSQPLDVVFPVLHGTYGEDGTIQGLLEMADVPFIGCGVLPSACGMDKTVMKALFREADLPICRHIWFPRNEWAQDDAAVVERVEDALGYPCFVKPANLGSSVGVSRAGNAGELRDAINLAAEFDRKVIVEEAVEGREIECGVIGNDDPTASLPGEYLIHDPTKAFLDYTEKYSGTGNNEFVVPAPVSPELSERIRDLAVRAFRAVDGCGLGRVDFFLKNDGGLLVNEINTMPGLTDASGFPKMWAGSGKPFAQVIDELVELAFQRHRDRSANKTSI